MSGPSYTAAEDRALAQLCDKHRSEWRRHIRDYPALDDRSIPSLIHRVHDRGLVRLGYEQAAAALSWPEPGVILFDDDPRAARDHGSPERLPHPEVMRSPFGCALNWLRGSGL